MQFADIMLDIITQYAEELRKKGVHHMLTDTNQAVSEAEHEIARLATDRLVKLEKLKASLGSLNWTQTKLAKATDYNVNTVTRWMTGHTEVPTIVLKYLEALIRIQHLEIPPAMMAQLEKLVKQHAGA